MSKIEDLLDEATPADVVPPTGAELLATLQRRRGRRKLVTVVGVFAAGLCGLIVFAGLDNNQRIELQPSETVADPQQDDRDGNREREEDRDGVDTPLATDADADADADATPEPSLPDAAKPQPASWQARWFLVPSEPTEIREITTGGKIREQAQQASISSIVVTSDPAEPSTAGLASIYHLDGADIFRIGSPEWIYRSVTVDGRPARVGSDPVSDRTVAIVSVLTGSFVASGVGLSEEQTIDLAAGVELVDGSPEPSDRFPAGFAVTSPPEPRPTDHDTTLAWGSGERHHALRLSRGPFEQVVLNLRSATAEPVSVRGVVGVFVPGSTKDDPPSISWVEDGYIATLSIDDAVATADVQQIAAVANALQRLDQAELVDYIGDPFMLRQAETVVGWLAATPPPVAWDPSPLLSSVPQGEFMMAFEVRSFLECTWFAAWGDAIRSDHKGRREEAEAILASRQTWPVYVVRAEAQRRLNPHGVAIIENEQEGTAKKIAAMRSVETLEQLAQVEADYGCGFVTPSG